jgi:hypothetical protein
VEDVGRGDRNNGESCLSASLLPTISVAQGLACDFRRAFALTGTPRFRLLCRRCIPDGSERCPSQGTNPRVTIRMSGSALLFGSPSAVAWFSPGGRRSQGMGKSVLLPELPRDRSAASPSIFASVCHLSMCGGAVRWVEGIHVL